MKYNILKLFVIVLTTLTLAGSNKAAPLAEDVGDVESFGRSALYMGASSGSFRLDDDCAAAPSPTPSGHCSNLNPAPALTTFTADEVCRIKLPKKATRSIIYPALNFFVNYQLRNSTGVDQPQGLFNYTATLSIESAALLNPAIIDPATGLPANGKLTNQFSYIYRDDRSMKDGDRHRQRVTLVRVGNAGINKTQLVAQGLSQAVVDALFASEMTIKMNVTGGAKLVTDASVTCNMRLFGD